MLASAAAVLHLHGGGLIIGSSAQPDVDPNRIAVIGESAGGGLAASHALLARDRGEIALAGQVLAYPMLDDRTGHTAS